MTNMAVSTSELPPVAGTQRRSGSNGSSSSTRLYLAFDCGGTKAAVAVSDGRGNIIGQGLGGAANYTDVGTTAFLKSVRSAVDNAMKEVALHSHGNANRRKLWVNHSRRWKRNMGYHQRSHSLQDEESEDGHGSSSTLAPAPGSIFEAAWFAIAGVDSPADVMNLSPLLADLLCLPHPSPRLIVANDTSLLAAPVHDSAFPHIKTGVVTIAGTGSIVMSYKQDSEGSLRTMGRVGGFGWLLGDEGSGFAVGRDAVRKVLEQADRERIHRDYAATEDPEDVFIGEDTAPSITVDVPERQLKLGEMSHLLRDRVLQVWNLTSTDGLFNAVYATQDPRKKLLESPIAARAGSDAPAIGSPTALHHQLPSKKLLPPDAPGLEQTSRSPSPVPPLSGSRPGTPVSSVGSGAEDEAGADKDDWDVERAEEVTKNSDDLLTPTGSLRRPLPTRPDHIDLSAVANGKGFQYQVNGTPNAKHLLGNAETIKMGERKHRLASLAPIVFHLAFNRNDALSLNIVRGQARQMALQILDVVRPDGLSRNHLATDRSVLCMGGSLLGVESYRKLLVGELAKLNVHFARTVFVNDPARGGATALAEIWEQKHQESV